LQFDVTGDAIDLFTPLLSGCGEATRALRAATTVIDAADTCRSVLFLLNLGYATKYDPPCELDQM